MSLIEVLVAMSITSLLLIMLGQVVLSSSRSARIAMTTTTTAADARTTVERMSKLLRVTAMNYQKKEETDTPVAFEEADHDSVTFYAAITTDTSSYDPIPTKVRYYWDSATKCLTEVTVAGKEKNPKPTSGLPYEWDTAPSRTRCLVKTAAPSEDKPLFTYFSSTELDGQGESLDALPVTSGEVASADLKLIRSVEIALSAADPSDPKAKRVNYLDKVALDNLLVSGGGK